MPRKKQHYVIDDVKVCYGFTNGERYVNIITKDYIYHGLKDFEKGHKSGRICPLLPSHYLNY